MDRYWRFETSAVHAGYQAEGPIPAVAAPIYQTAAFAFSDAQHAADLFEHRKPGYTYTRLGNPSLRFLEERVAALEQGAGAVVLASGQAAVACSLLTLVGAGENIVATSSLYGTTYSLLSQMLPQYGIQVRFCRYDDHAAIGSAIDEGTRAVFCESLANPSGHVADLRALAEMAHRNQVPLVVDNTLATPYLCQPILHGADVVVHSLTKYMAGHGVALGGAVVDSGRFPWRAAGGKFKRVTEAAPGLPSQPALDEQIFLSACISGPVRTMGAVMSPLNAFLIGQGVETLALRMERICFNAEVIARYLVEHPSVAWVHYPALPQHADNRLCHTYLGGKASGVMSFGIRGGRERASAFQDALQLFRRSTNLGDCKSLVCHPASTTHRRLSLDELKQCGVPDDLVRLSLGIEHVEDLLGDLERALAAAA